MGDLLAGEPGGFDTGLAEGVAGVVDAGWEGWRSDGEGDAGVAPAVGMACNEACSGELPEMLHGGAEQGCPDLWRVFEVVTTEGFAGLGDEAGGAGWDAILFVVLAGGPGEVGGLRMAHGVTI